MSVEMDSKQFQLEVLTENFLMQGTVQPVGMLMTHLDSPDRHNLLFKNVTMTGLAPESTVDSIKIKELWVQRKEILAICLNEADLQGLVRKLPAKEKLRLYLPRFMIQGTLTRGQDTRLGDMFEVMKGTWTAVMDARLFPLTAVKAHAFREAPFLLVNKDQVRFYEAVSPN